MLKATLLASIMTLMPLCFMLIAQAQSGNDTVTAQDVKKETTGLNDTLQQYTAEQRDQAVKEAEQALKKLDGCIDELETRVDSNWDNITQAAQQTHGSR